MPAIFFRYELSPIRIQYLVSMMSFTTFIVRICAIVGGIYSVSSIFESVLRNSIGVFGIGSVSEELDYPGQGRKKGPKPKVIDYQTAPTEESKSSADGDSIEMQTQNMSIKW